MTRDRRRQEAAMAPGIEILSAANAHLLESIAPDVFDFAIDPQQLDAFLNDPRHILVLAVDDGIVVGMASGTELFHPDKPPQLFINEVGVAETHQRQGIGRELVGALVKLAKERGCTCAWLGTDTDNVAGQACFGSVPGASKPQPFLLYEWEFKE